MCKVISKYKLYLILNNEKFSWGKKKLLKYEKNYFICSYTAPTCMNKKKEKITED